MVELSEFSREIIKTIKKVPRGKVATYSQIARVVGNPQAIRRVVWILHACSQSHRLPWHRIVSAKGKISFPAGSRHFLKQRRLLLAEGVSVPETGEIDLDKYQWQRLGRKKPAGGTAGLGGGGP